jgi:hypothetical protein
MSSSKEGEASDASPSSASVVGSAPGAREVLAETCAYVMAFIRSNQSKLGIVGLHAAVTLFVIFVLVVV